MTHWKGWVHKNRERIAEYCNFDDEAKRHPHLILTKLGREFQKDGERGADRMLDELLARAKR